MGAGFITTTTALDCPLHLPCKISLRIPRNLRCEFHSKFGLGIPRNSQNSGNLFFKGCMHAWLLNTGSIDPSVFDVNHFT